MARNDLNQMWTTYDNLTARCEGLAQEIRKGDPTTTRLAIAQFTEVNEARLELAEKLGLRPYGV